MYQGVQEMIEQKYGLHEFAVKKNVFLIVKKGVTCLKAIGIRQISSGTKFKPAFKSQDSSLNSGA
ncbi:MAG: hypothetical protein EA411_09620 [Saprospirales bacterium]|nr:MAG: hypothetical protein EA411_09620 [Saprospirales bacterium]